MSKGRAQPYKKMVLFGLAFSLAISVGVAWGQADVHGMDSTSPEASQAQPDPFPMFGERVPILDSTGLNEGYFSKEDYASPAPWPTVYNRGTGSEFPAIEVTNEAGSEVIGYYVLGAAGFRPRVGDWEIDASELDASPPPTSVKPNEPLESADATDLDSVAGR